jgi:creatinine amidohydrolase
MRRDLLELTQPEVAELLARSATCVLPLGSTEQHGPHLPMGTDTYAALAIAKAVAEELDALVVPVTPLGVTPLHASFPGTLSLEPETLVAVLTDVGRSLARHGLQRLLVLNWHEGNIPAIDLATARLATTTDLHVVVAQACYVARDRWGERTGGLSHGGELEVLPLLTLVPELVHLERADNPSPPERGRRLDAARRHPSVYPVLRDVREIAPTGWYGEPRHATAAKGEAFIADMGRSIAEAARAAFAALADLRSGHLADIAGEGDG